MRLLDLGHDLSESINVLNQLAIAPALGQIEREEPGRRRHSVPTIVSDLLARSPISPMMRFVPHRHPTVLHRRRMW
jgi:hypothetical protein